MRKIFLTITVLISFIVFANGQGSIVNQLGGNSATDTYDIIDSDGNILFRVTGEGKVGIGRTTPSYKLDVFGMTHTIGFKMYPGTNGWVLTSDGNGVGTWQALPLVSETDPQVGAIMSNSVPKWNGSALVTGTIYNLSGKIGIGTTTPDEKLHIGGNMRLNGAFEDKDGDAGTAGQILSSTVTGTDWIDAPSGGAGWELTGNAGTTAGTNFFGTTDNVALEVKVNNQRVMRYEPDIESPNVIGGYSGNIVSGGIVGAFIGGGGVSLGVNSVTADYGTVVGGSGNLSSGIVSTAMGYNTIASGQYSTAMGSLTTASGNFSTAMSEGTIASGLSSTAMGFSTTASGTGSIAMGSSTTASGDYSIAMGQEIEASGDYTVAIALNDQNGTNVTQANTMAIMGGNVGIGTSTPSEKLEVAGKVRANTGFNFNGTDGVTGTYNFYNDDTSGNVTSITVSGGIITNVTTTP